MLPPTQKLVTARLDTALLISCRLFSAGQRGKNNSAAACVPFGPAVLLSFFKPPKLIIIVALAAALPPIFIFLADPYESIAECLTLINPND